MNSKQHNPGREARPAREAKPTREERLAAKLRENLHRRKAQARALDHRTIEPDPGDLPKPDTSG